MKLGTVNNEANRLETSVSLEVAYQRLPVDN
jgi:hypothetical protein